MKVVPSDGEKESNMCRRNVGQAGGRIAEWDDEEQEYVYTA
jgi:hypothetical protein